MVEGILEFAQSGGKTVLSRALAPSPLTLFSPRRGAGNNAWTVTGTLGGGMVSGDEIRLSTRVGPGCSAVLGTQASTKIYRSPDRLACRQELLCQVDAGALLVVAPDPVTCFAGSVYEQRLRFDLDASATLVLVDWITSGRRARGERWEMTSCRLRTDVWMAGRQTIRDAIQFDGATAGRRMTRFDCWATVILIGNRVAEAVRQMLLYIDAQSLVAGADLMVSAGPVAGGMILRIAGGSTEAVLDFFRRRLSFLMDLAGEDPWSRKG